MKKLIVVLLVLIAGCDSGEQYTPDAFVADAWAYDATRPPDATPPDAALPDAQVQFCHHKTKGVLIGDSIVQNLYLSARTMMQADGDILFKVAVAGAKVEDQYQTWIASTLRGDQSIDWFYVQAGINNVLAGGQSASVIENSMTVLLQDIYARHPTATVFFVTMDPAKSRLDTIPGPARYPVWKQLNENYILKGADDTISQSLNDGNDNLALNYAGPDGLHPNTSGDLATAAILQQWLDLKFPDIPCTE